MGWERQRGLALLLLLLGNGFTGVEGQACVVEGAPCTDLTAQPGDACEDINDGCLCSVDLLCLPPPNSGWIPQWVLGVVLYSFGAMMINLGSNVVKYGHSRREEAEASGDVLLLTRASKLRAGGWTLFSLGGAFNFLSFSYGTQSLLSALAAIQFVTNIFFGAVVNGETVTLRIVIGTVIICAGVTLIVVFGPKKEENYDIGALISLWTRWPILAWVGGNAFFFVVLEVVRRKLAASEDETVRAAEALAGGKAGSPRGGESEAVLREKAAYLRNWRGVVYGSTSAILGSQSTLFMKSLSELLKGLLTRGEFGALINPFTYAILGGFVGSLAFWLMRLNRGLAEFDALFIVPVMQVQWTTLSVIEGIIYFQEYRELDLTAGIVFFAALLVIFFGVYLLSSGGGGSSKSYAPVPSSEENWDPTDPTTPRIITAEGIKDLDSSTLEKFGMLLSVTQVAGREAWQVGWLAQQELGAKNSRRKMSGSPKTPVTRGA